MNSSAVVGMKRMKYRDSPAALVSGVSCLLVLHSLLHYGCSVLTERGALWTTIGSLKVFLMQQTLGSVRVSRSGNSCPDCGSDSLEDGNVLTLHGPALAVNFDRNDQMQSSHAHM